MGSRGVAIVGRDRDAIEQAFRISSDTAGTLYTRTGRRFLADESLERSVLDRLRRAIDRAGLWTELDTDWLAIDLEVLPWSVKAGELLITQYATVASAAEQSFLRALRNLESAADRGVDLGGLLERTRDRASLITAYRDVYRRYCWDVDSVDELRLAPFHILGGGCGSLLGGSHLWHMDVADRLAEAGEPVMIPTRNRRVDIGNSTSEEEATAWWLELTSGGAEGMVVKPLEFLAQGSRTRVQPALKCRGVEYLRIIYGPEYTLPGNLDRLRERSLGLKRSMAVREFALGVEGLERFFGHEGLYRVHECAFAVLALESEPVDSRL